MKSFLVLAVAVVAISWASILIRMSSSPALIIAFYRLAISAVVLLPFARLSSIRGWFRGGGEGWPAIGAGLLLALHFATWITSLKLTTVASSVILVTTTPVFAAALSSRVLGESVSSLAWSGIALSVGGSALIAWGDARSGSVEIGDGTPNGQRLIGDVLALAGALFAAAYLTVGRRSRSRTPLTSYLTVLYAAGGAGLAVAALLHGDRFGGYSLREYILFATIAVVPNVVGHSLLNWGVRRMRTYVVNVAVLGEPVLATVYAAFLFGEIPGTFWALGTAMIFAGVLLVVLGERSRRVTEAELA